MLLLAVAIQAHDLDRPFTGRHDFATAHEAVLARNHVRYGLSDTRGRPTFTRYQPPYPDARRFYPDHPPLTDLLLAGSLALFGEHDWAIRLLPAACSAAAVALVMSIANGVYGRRVALLAGTAMSLLPIEFYFGRIANHEPVVLALWLAALRGYLGWMMPERFGERARRDAGLFAAATILSMLTGWVAFLQAALVALHYLTCRGRRSAAGWALVLLPAIVGGSLTLAQILLMFDGRIENVWAVFRFRAGLSDSEEPFTFAGWLARQARWGWQNFGVIGLALAAIGAGAALFDRRSADAPHSLRSDAPSDAAPQYHRPGWLLGTAGLLFVVIFRSGSYNHEYWWLHVTPGAALCVAVGIDWLLRSRRRGPVAGVLVPALLLAGLAAENAVFWNRYRHENRLAARAYEACRFIRTHSRADATIYGNRGLWIRREYHAGAMGFMQPQTDWCLDRRYEHARSPAELQRIAPQCRFYLWIGQEQRDRPVLEYLVQNARLLARFSQAAVFDLTQPAQRGATPGSRVRRESSHYREGLYGPR
ncbi:MAG: glycosyltransferase family 39 protein [Phycisphaerae bacterium]